MAQSFFRAPEVTWGKLDEITKKKYIDAFEKIRIIKPKYNNFFYLVVWLNAFLFWLVKSPIKRECIILLIELIIFIEEMIDILMVIYLL